MMKKIGIAALVAVLGLGVVSRTEVGRWTWSHVRLGWSEAGEGLKSLVGIEQEMKRLDKEIDELKGDISGSYKPLAREKVDVEHLKRDIAASEKDLSVKEKVLKGAKSELDGARSQVVVGNEKKIEKVQKEFTSAWQLFDTAERNLATKKEVLQRKEELVEQAQGKIKAMIERQGMLKVKLVGLRTEFEKVQAAQAKSSVKIDEGRLGAIDRDMEAVAKRIKEMSTELALKEKFEEGGVSVETKVEQTKAEDEFEARFGNKKVVKDNE